MLTQKIPLVCEAREWSVSIKSSRVESPPKKSPNMICSRVRKKKTESQLSNGNDGGEEEDYSKWNEMTQRSDSSVRASDKIIFFCEKVFCRFFGVLLLEKWYSESFLIYCLRAARTHNWNRPTMEKKVGIQAELTKKAQKCVELRLQVLCTCPLRQALADQRSVIEKRPSQNWSTA